MRPLVAMGTAATVLLALLLGCGGHGGPSSSSSAASTTSVGKGKGRAVLTVKWPARSSARLVPNAANSITVSLLQGTAVVASTTVARPPAGQTTTSTTFTGLAYGGYTVWAQAFPNADGSGVAQAYGGGAMAVAEDFPGSLGVSLGSSVASLAVVPAAPMVGPGGTVVLTASAEDASGNVVLLAAGGGAESLTWTSDSPAIATVSGTGPTATLTGVALGTAHVTATLRTDDAGDVVSTGPTAVTVAATTVSVSPASALLYYGYVQTGQKQYTYKAVPPLTSFQATLGASLAGSTVVWSVTGSGSKVGTIRADGVYVAPSYLVAKPTVHDTIVATVMKNGVSYTGSARVSTTP